MRCINQDAPGWNETFRTLDLTNGPFHLQLNQAIHFDGVLHRQFLYQRFDEAINDHRARLRLVSVRAHQVEQLLSPIRDTLVHAQYSHLLENLDVRIGITSALRIENQSIANDIAL